MSLCDFLEIFEDGEIVNLMRHDIPDPWKGTPFEGYIYLSTNAKGRVGERILSKYMQMKFNSTIQDRVDAGHDLIVDDIKVEVKLTLPWRKQKKVGNILRPTGELTDSFWINHISPHKSWERLIVVKIDRNIQETLVWFTKEDFQEEILGDSLHFISQNGASEEKSDYKVKTNRTLDFIENSPITRPIETWHSADISQRPNKPSNNLDGFFNA